jgi:hypothetical protein
MLLFVGPDQLLVGELVGVEHGGGHQEGRFALDGPREGLRDDGHRGLDLPLGAVRWRALTRASWTRLLGMWDELGRHREPLRARLQLTGKCGLGVGLAGEALVAQMPQHLFPRRADVLDLAGQRRPDPLLTRGGAPHDPAFAGRRLWGWRPEEVALLTPPGGGHAQGRFRLRGGVGHAADRSRTPAAERRATFSTLSSPLSATQMGVCSSSTRSCSASASTAATKLTVSLAVPSSAWQNSGTSPMRVVASASIHCGQVGAVVARVAIGDRQRVCI